MSIFKIIWNFNTPKIFRTERSLYSISHNDEIIENLSVISFALHSRTYRLLRKLTTPSFNKVFLMRNKKGFNTLLFPRSYDIVITNKDGIVIKTFIDYPEGSISRYEEKAFNIFFFTVGSINNYKLKEKDSLRVHNKFLELIKDF